MFFVFMKCMNTSFRCSVESSRTQGVNNVIVYSITLTNYVVFNNYTTCNDILQTSISVIVIHVTLTPFVSTLMGASLVHVTCTTQETDLLMQVIMFIW